MAWSVSAIFQQALLNPIARSTAATTGFPTGYSASSTGLVGDTVNAALFLTGASPDKTAAVGSTGYNTGTWTTTNEAPGTGNYTQGGTALSGKSVAIDSGSSSLCFTAGNPSWTTATIANVFGDLVYDNTISGGTVSKQGMCFNYFGGSQSVTSGTFTVQWATPPSGGVTAVFNISV